MKKLCLLLAVLALYIFPATYGTHEITAAQPVDASAQATAKPDEDKQSEKNDTTKDKEAPPTDKEYSEYATMPMGPVPLGADVEVMQ